ncbi:MAG: aminoacyl-tRNA hydrolase [Cirrosporium novae-zelandiae]|nr:MAG: aminoacyl-tRNA hydrolase [Cirrosporium novae-zelandiae]
MASAVTIRILLASIGNPAPYTNTLHSTGHLVLSRIQNLLSYPPFSKSRPLASGLLSHSNEDVFTLWMSPTLMNVSGPAVVKAYNTWKRDNSLSGEADAKKLLIILHDELELPLGQVKLKKGATSHRGHNGLRSIKETMRGDDYLKLGIGIGRPTSREKGDVANFVLRKMGTAEREKVKNAADEAVRIVREIAEGRRKI